MATRSRIGYLNDQGNIVSAYCHWDGYPSHNGAILRGFYDTLPKVQELLSIGDMSSLGPRCDAPQGQPTSDHTIYYGRDRGEEPSPTKTHASKAELLDESKQGWVDYVYLFENGSWTYAYLNGDGSFQPLTAEVCAN
jgi:hypothetical protein